LYTIDSFRHTRLRGQPSKDSVRCKVSDKHVQLIYDGQFLTHLLTWTHM